ncbi:hypothetical protein K8I31_16705 [bacterium]|nr:hypothetical protein [bacterium]
MNEKREWIKCSAVSIAFYLIVYVLLGSTVLDYLNPWLIGIVILMAIGDVFGLKWMIQHFGDSDDDDEYP